MKDTVIIFDANTPVSIHEFSANKFIFIYLKNKIYYVDTGSPEQKIYTCDYNMDNIDVHQKNVIKGLMKLHC